MHLGGKAFLAESGAVATEKIILETKDLLLRELTQEDLQPWHAILSDAETMQYYPHPLDEAETQAWIDRNIKRYETDGFGLWAMLLKETGAFIGDCGLTLQNIHGDGRLFPEVGFHLDKLYWHRGYATQAARAVLTYAFAHTDFPEVFCYQKWTNAPSRRMAERLGMTLREEYPDEKNTQTSVYSVTREEFDARKA